MQTEVELQEALAVRRNGRLVDGLERETRIEIVTIGERWWNDAELSTVVHHEMTAAHLVTQKTCDCVQLS